MRSESEIKAKVIELMDLEGEERSDLVQAMDALDVPGSAEGKSRGSLGARHALRSVLGSRVFFC